MPRDLQELKNGLLGDKPSPEKTGDEKSSISAPPAEIKDRITRDMERDDQINEVKPYVQTLNLSDVDSCLKLEQAVFPPNEQASREKFIYRFSKCGELSLGLFTSADVSSQATSDSDPATAATASTARPVYSGAPHRKAVLLGHAVVTKTTNDVVTDDDMALPPDWEKSTATTPGSESHQLGHKEEGRTICIHSLAILPEFQKRGLGRLLMKSYINRMETSGVADRIALIAHDDFLPFYESLGFVNKGKSKAQFGGGGWTDMVLELKNDK